MLLVHILDAWILYIYSARWSCQLTHWMLFIIVWFSIKLRYTVPVGWKSVKRFIYKSTMFYWMEIILKLQTDFFFWAVCRDLFFSSENKYKENSPMNLLYCTFCHWIRDIYSQRSGKENNLLILSYHCYC